MKKLLFRFTAILLVFILLSTSVSALNDVLDCGSYSTAEEVNTFLEEGLIENIEGYEIESVETDFSLYGGEELTETGISLFISKIISFFTSLFYKTTNRKVSNPFYYKDEYETYLYKGACKVDTEYTLKKGVKKNINGNISDSVIEKATGYKINRMYEQSSSFRTDVKANRMICVRVYALYRRTSFDFVNKITGKVTTGNYVDRMEGIYIVSTTYKLK